MTVSGLSGAIEADAGESHVCARVGDGQLRCWGRNSDGQLGDGTTGTLPDPTAPTTLPATTSLAIGYEHACAGTTDGHVWCWGSDLSGQLGNTRVRNSSSVPVQVSGITNAKSVAAGRHHSCALLTDGRVKCWGNGASGQLGIGSTVEPGARR